MIELNPLRKNKINLSDYPFEDDIKNRMLLSNLSIFDVEVLEEILYSPLKIPFEKICRNLDVEKEDIQKTLEKLLPLKLFSLERDTIFVDKEARKYFEFQVMKFDEDFKPDMEFLLGLLKKVPIHILPIWYSIPRTSNNIFESIIEKYLHTPQLFQRYTMELGYNDPVFTGIMEDLFEADDFKVYASDLKSKYELDDETFAEYLVHLEFNFICTLSYTKVGDQWEEVVTPFHEWREYLIFLKNSNPDPIPNTSLIKRKRPSNFAFVEDLTRILVELKKRPLSFSNREDFKQLLRMSDEKALIPYLKELSERMFLIQLIEEVDGEVRTTSSADEWLEMTTETKALYLYRHPQNKLLRHKAPHGERHQRESEKSIKAVIDHGWVYFDDFIKGALIPLNDEQKVCLTKKGKTWKYQIPEYSEEDCSFIHAALFEGLFEVGMIATGTMHGRDCFTVTPFGQTFFGS